MAIEAQQICHNPLNDSRTCLPVCIAEGSIAKSSIAKSSIPRNIIAENGYIHSYETLGALDGPGIRFVVFLSGCPLRCIYCHNPDTRQLKGGRLADVAEVMSEINKYKHFIACSRGGVTISGGEPLLQESFTTQIFHSCRSIGLHTALDTSGYTGSKVSKDLLEVVNLVLLDIKSINPERFKAITGRALQPTLDFARLATERAVPLWIRFVLIPGITDFDEDHHRFAQHVSTLQSVERVEVLPFHNMGEFKWRNLGLDYQLSDVQPPAESRRKEVVGIFRSYGLTAE